MPHGGPHTGPVDGDDDTGGIQLGPGQQLIDWNTGKTIRIILTHPPLSFEPGTLLNSANNLPLSGQFVTGAGRLFEIRQGKQVGGSRLLNDRERQAFGIGIASSSGGGGGGGGGITFEQQLQLLGIQNEQALELFRLRAELDRELRGADRDLQRELLERRAVIDRQLREMGFEHELRILDKRLEFEAEQGELNRANQERLQAISELGALQRSVLQAQTEAEGMIASLQGQDPFRAAIATRGSVRLGVTPQIAQVSRLRRFVDTPAPQVDPGASLEEITAAIGGGGQAQIPQPETTFGTQQPLGLRGGGVLEMSRNGRGMFTLQQDSSTPDLEGPTGIGVMVGEKGPEVMEVMADGTIRIIPLKARGQGGLTLTPQRRPRLGTGQLTRGFDPTRFTQPERRVRIPEGLRRARVPDVTIERAAPPGAVAMLAPSLQAPQPTALTPSLQTARPQAIPVQEDQVRQEARAAGVTVGDADALLEAAGATQQTGLTPQTQDFAQTQNVQPGTPGFDWLTSLIARWPNVTSQDALVAQQLGNDGTLTQSDAQTISDAILQFVGGTLGDQSALSILEGLLGTESVPVDPTAPLPILQLPPGVDPQEALDLIQQVVDQLTAGFGIDQNLAGLAAQLGLHDLATLINEFVAGLLSRVNFIAILQDFIPRIEDQTLPDFDVQELERAILELWEELGIDPIRIQQGDFGGNLFDFENVRGGLTTSGFQPQLLRNSETGQVFIWASGANILAPITPPGEEASRTALAAAGITPNGEGVFDQIFTVTPEELARFGTPRGSILLPDQIREILTPRGTDPFPRLAQPLIEPNTGLLLPAPKAIVGLLQRLDRTNPNRAFLIRNAYELAGFNLDDLAARQNFFTFRGTRAQGSVRFG